MATLTLRLSDELKSEATKVAEYYGFDLESVTRVFYSQMVRERSISLGLGNSEPNERSLQAIAEAEAGDATGDCVLYDDADSLLDAAFLRRRR